MEMAIGCFVPPLAADKAVLIIVLAHQQFARGELAQLRPYTVLIDGVSSVDRQRVYSGRSAVNRAFLGLKSLAVCVFFTTSAFAGLASAAGDGQPQRIVSLNLCTDQLLLHLVEPGRISSLTFLSSEAGATPPEFQAIVRRVKANHGLAEEVLALDPDLVLTGAYAARTTTALLRRVGKRVVVFEPENSFDDMRANLRRMGAAVGEPERAEQVIAAFDAELAALQRQTPPGEAPVFADIGVNYWMAGKGTLYGAIVNAGGFRTLGDVMNFSGHRSVPLETLVQIKPALLSTDTQYERPPSLSTRALHHPLLRRMAAETPRLNIPPRYTVCATPESLKAVRMLIGARKTLEAKAAVN